MHASNCNLDDAKCIRKLVETRGFHPDRTLPVCLKDAEAELSSFTVATYKDVEDFSGLFRIDARIDVLTFFMDDKSAADGGRSEVPPLGIFG
jgi:hypothetical protein